MTKAAITPGTQAQSVNKNTINTEPHPLSKTAKGGNTIANSTRKKLNRCQIFNKDTQSEGFAN
jgi:hypothetical protein